MVQATARIFMPNRPISKSESLEFELMRLLEVDPSVTQREIADRLDISLGHVNYCLKALIQRGSVKIDSYRAPDHKLHNVYVLTPQGLAERVGLTRRVLEGRVQDFERLKVEIDALRHEIGERGAEHALGASASPSPAASVDRQAEATAGE